MKSEIIEYKNFTKRIGLIGITNLIIGFSGFILLPILTKSLTADNYGIWIQASVTITLIPAFVSLGLPYAMVRYMASEKDKKTIKENFYSIIFTVMTVSLITSALMFILSGPIAKLLFGGNVFIAQMLACITFFVCMNNIVVNYFRTFHQITKYSVMNFLMTYVGVIIVSALLLSGYGLKEAIIGLFASQVLVFLVMSLYIFRDIGFTIPKFTNMSEYLSFGLPTVFGNISFWIIDVSDRYLIGILLGAAYVGYYSPGYTLGGIINMMSAPIFLMLPSTLSRYYDANDMANVKKILSYSMKYFLIIAIPAAIGLSLLSRPILMILTTKDIAQNGYLITPFIVISMLLYGIRTINSQILVMEKKTKIIGFVWSLAAIINLILNLIIIPRMGLIGAAITTLIAYSVTFVLIEFYSNKYIKLDRDWKLLSKIGAASAVMALAIIAWQPTGIINVILAISLCTVLYFAALFLLNTFKENEIRFFKELAFKIRS